MTYRKKEILGGTPQFKVTVTPDIIGKAIERNSNHCMIAEAVKASNPKLSHVCVDIQTIRATNRQKGERYVWLTPRAAQIAIIDFDHGSRPEPFKFILRTGQTVTARVKTQKQKEKMREMYHTKYKPLKQKAAVKIRGRSSGNGTKVMPDVIGGRLPPSSPGARRGFGLRSLQY